MAPRKEAADKPAKKTKSGGGNKKGKVSPYNKFMKDELARLKESDTSTTHAERFKIAAGNWAKAKENPKNSAAK